MSRLVEIWESGEWLISHVYAVLNRPEVALYHAQRCLDLCQESNVKDFDIAYERDRSSPTERSSLSC